VVLTQNKIDHIVALSRQAALAYGASTGVVERSPFDDCWYEPTGFFGESVIPERYTADGGPAQPPQVLATGRAMVARMAANPYGFRKGEGGSQGADADFLDSLPRPLWFLPMDNVLWTGLGQPDHPQRPVDYPIFEDYRDALAEIAAAVERIGGTLVVKHHPSCLLVNQQSLARGAIFHDGDLRLLIEKADVVVTLLTKLAFVALAMGKPVVTLAHNPVAASGSTYHCTQRVAIGHTLRAALAQEDLKDRLDKFVPFCGWLAGRFFISMDQAPALPQRTPADLADELIDQADSVLPLTQTELASGYSLLLSIATAADRARAHTISSALRTGIKDWSGWPRLHHNIQTVARTLAGAANADVVVQTLFGRHRSDRLRRRYERDHPPRKSPEP
jgi:hypothetical protein